MMTKAVREDPTKDESSSNISSYLKDEYGTISDHLCSHVHLTNCIHLKNQMHRRSPNFSLAERSLIRDLISLQKSRSLRDPSTSPASWFSSPYIVGSFAMEASKDGSTSGRRRSTGVGRPREAGRLFKSSSLMGSNATAKVAAEEAASDYQLEERERNSEVTKGSESAGTQKSGTLSGSQVSVKATSHDVTGLERKEPNGQFLYPKILSEQLADFLYETGNFCKKRSGLVPNGRNESVGRTNGETEGSIHDRFRQSNRGRKFRLKGARRARGSIDLRSIGAHHNQIVTSIPIAKGSNNCKGCQEDVAEDKMLEAGHSVAKGSHNCKGCQEDAPEERMLEANVCGIPWNWSRLHHRGKTFLDMAGRSLSCGLSDSGMKHEGPVSQIEGDTSNLAAASDQFASSTSSEVLPLLTEGQESHGSGANCSLSRDYSGELEIFSNHYLGHDGDSDLESEARSMRWRSRRHVHGRHRSLTQKYIPKTFKDLVGQNLVVQALCNSILRRKIGLVYVFYGPHGTGKTTCARVFAKALNCQSMEHPKPCDACSSCISCNLGRCRDVLEVGPVGNFDLQSISDINNLMFSSRSSLYKVFILDDCDSLPSKLWSVILKVIDQAPRHVIFVLVCSNLDRMPHSIISRCQKFFFPKIRDSDIISTLQWIATSEGLEIDKDALKLIASHSDGSLRDAEMTLDQLSLLGKKISLPLVQELVGLVSDEKLVDLLDLALSADTVNTVKNLREIIETGVDPITLMSQLAALVTDILAGSYVFTQERLHWKFFHQPTLTKGEMERLRQALKKLSEAEKQLRDSNDKLTWLTAALLQLAPEHQYVLPSSSRDRSLNHNAVITREMHRNSANKQSEVALANRSSARGVDRGHIKSSDTDDGSNCITVADGREQFSHNFILSGEAIEEIDIYDSGKRHKNTEKIWGSVLEHIPSDTLRQFLCREGSLVSVSLGTAPIVQLMFNSSMSTSRAENFREQILQAFEYVLQCPVILEIRCKSRTSAISDDQEASILSGFESALTRKQRAIKKQKSIYSGPEDLTGKIEDNVLGRISSSEARCLRAGPHVMTEDEIIETRPHEHELINKILESKEKAQSTWEEASTSQDHANLVPFSEKENGKNQRKCLVRGKVSLAHVIQQVEGCSSRGGWSRRKAMSIAEKLEQENLKLEPRSRTVFRWRAFRTPRTKPLKLRIRATRKCSLSNLVSCGRCLQTRSPK